MNIRGQKSANMLNSKIGLGQLWPPLLFSFFFLTNASLTYYFKVQSISAAIKDTTKGNISPETCLSCWHDTMTQFILCASNSSSFIHNLLKSSEQWPPYHMHYMPPSYYLILRQFFAVTTAQEVHLSLRPSVRYLLWFLNLKNA